MSFNTFAITGSEFVNCFDKALKERIKEIKAEDPDVNICNGLSANEKATLFELYSYVDDNGFLRYYGDDAMGEVSVRFHYDRIKWEFECYENPSNIASAWVIGFGSAIGATNRTNIDLAKETMSILLGRDMWTENGSDLFSDHNFDYCTQVQAD